MECDAVDGSVVIGNKQILFSFNLNAPPEYKIKANYCFVEKDNLKKMRQDPIFLGDSNHNPVDFNIETLTFTIQSINI